MKEIAGGNSSPPPTGSSSSSSPLQAPVQISDASILRNMVAFVTGNGHGLIYADGSGKTNWGNGVSIVDQVADAERFMKAMMRGITASSTSSSESAAAASRTPLTSQLRTRGFSPPPANMPIPQPKPNPFLRSPPETEAASVLAGGNSSHALKATRPIWKEPLSCVGVPEPAKAPPYIRGTPKQPPHFRGEVKAPPNIPSLKGLISDAVAENFAHKFQELRIQVNLQLTSAWMKLPSLRS